MTAEIVSLNPGLVGDGYKIASDDVLTAAIGKLSRLVLVGEDADGELYIAGTDGAADSTFLMERAKLTLVQSMVLRS